MSHHRHLGKIPGYRKLAPQAGFEPATLRLTGELLCRAAEGGPMFMGLCSVGPRRTKALPMETKTLRKPRHSRAAAGDHSEAIGIVPDPSINGRQQRGFVTLSDHVPD
jgi:hypothetical protein